MAGLPGTLPAGGWTGGMLRCGLRANAGRTCDVLPGDMLPGDILPGGVLPGDVLPDSREARDSATTLGAPRDEVGLVTARCGTVLGRPMEAALRLRVVRPRTALVAVLRRGAVRRALRARRTIRVLRRLFLSERVLRLNLRKGIWHAMARGGLLRLISSMGRVVRRPGAMRGYLGPPSRRTARLT